MDAHVTTSMNVRKVRTGVTGMQGVRTILDHIHVHVMQVTFHTLVSHSWYRDYEITS